MSASAIIKELIEDEENPAALDIDFDGLEEAIDGINERRHGDGIARLKAVGAPPWLWDDLHECVSNDAGVCERCINPRVGA